MFLKGEVLINGVVPRVISDGNYYVHAAAFSLSVLLSGIWAPIISHNPPTHAGGNIFVTISSVMFSTISLMLISDIREDRSESTQAYNIRSLILVAIYSTSILIFTSI